MLSPVGRIQQQLRCRSRSLLSGGLQQQLPHRAAKLGSTWLASADEPGTGRHQTAGRQPFRQMLHLRGFPAAIQTVEDDETPSHHGRSARAFTTTVTELRAISNAAIGGDSSSPWLGSGLGRDRKSDQVVPEGPGQFCAPSPECAVPAAVPRQIVKPIPEQHQMLCLGDLSAGADRDAEVRRRQGRRVIDAVPHHRHLPLTPQLLQALQLLLRTHLPTQFAVRKTELFQTPDGDFDPH